MFKIFESENKQLITGVNNQCSKQLFGCIQHKLKYGEKT